MAGRRIVTARRGSRAALLSVVALFVIAVGSPPAIAVPIDSAGPLTHVEISTDLNCSVNHTGDAAGEFFGNTACGTLLASGGTLYGPASIPAGGSASPRTAFTPVSQSPVTGTGTGADPFTVVTVVTLGTSGLRITETDRYVTGEESYRTDVTVANLNDVQATAILYRAGDCFLQNSDAGFGSADPTTGSVSCVAGVTDGTGTVPGTRIEQWFPLSAGSHYLEDAFGSVWARIGAQLPFTDSCAQCTSYIDNGAGLSWEFTVPAGGSATRSHLTVFSPLGNVPLSTTKTADAGTAAAGDADGYTITIHNPNTVAVSLDAITDTLPAGFSYTTGSTTGATTANPSISSQDLSWSGPISVPASGDASIHFNVTVASTPGDYFNNAGGTAEGFTVAPTGDTAEVTVTGGVGDVPGPPTDVTADPGDGSATVSWTAPDSDGGSPIDGYTVTCTATADAGDTHSATVDGATTSAVVGGLTNDVEYACAATAHNTTGDSDPSAPSPAFTPTGGDAQFSTTFDTSQGSELALVPQPFEGTIGHIIIPPQPGPPTEVTVTASLFGHPGEVDPTCGGNVCVGQGIEWSVSNPDAIKVMRIIFFESPRLVHGRDVRDAVVYKDGVPVANCSNVGGFLVAGRHHHPRPSQETPCVAWRHRTFHGGWWIALRVDGSDPKGRL